MNDDGTYTCPDCMMESTKEQVEDGDIQHWNDCPRMIDDSDFTGATNEDR